MKGSIVALGIFVLVIGVILCFYPVEYTQYLLGYPVRTWVEYPYQGYGFILFLVGIAVLVVGLAIPKKIERPVPSLPTPPQPIKRVCPQCGQVLTEEAKFCPSCGKQLKTD